MLSNRAVSCFLAILCYILFFSPSRWLHFALHVHIILVSCIVYIFSICVPFCTSQHTEVTDVEMEPPHAHNSMALRYAA